MARLPVLYFGTDMITILVLFIVFIVLVSLLAVASARLMGRVMGRAVHDRLKAAEYIVRTHQAPSEWATVSPGALAGGRSADRARGSLVRRLDKLVTYLKSAPVFEDDNARGILLGELGRARQMWLTQSLRSIIGSGGQPIETQSEEQPPD